MFPRRIPLEKVVFLYSLLLVAAAAIFVFDGKGLFITGRTVFTAPFVPIIGKAQAVRAGATNRISAFATVGRYEQNQIRLEFLDRHATVLEDQVKTLTEENETLRRELSLGSKTGVPLVDAKIVAISDTITIVTSGNAAIQIGSAVLLDNALLGIVSDQRTTNLYDVLPTVHPTFKAKVRFSHDDTTYEGIAQGQFGTSLTLTKVLSTAKIGEGDIVVMNDPDKPKALDTVIGKIASVVSDQAQVFIEAKIVPPAIPTPGQMVFIRN